MSFAAVLLAGGRSSRMGRDKAWLPWGGHPLWEVQMEKLVALGPDRLLLSCRPDQGFSLSALSALGPMPCALSYDPPGTASAMEALAGCFTELRTEMLVLAVDLPRMRLEILRALVSEFQKSGRGVVYEIAGGLEPLCAVYSLGMREILRDCVARGDLGLQKALRRGIACGCMDVLPLPPEWETAFRNTNTPEEWTNAQPSP